MKLKAIKLKNFRSYTDVEIKISENLSLIIGKNDIGKSTIMEALEIFFNGENRNTLVKAEIEDCNISSVEKYFEISCIFEIEEETPIYLDTTHSTNLIEEHLLNKDGNLEIVKRWNCSGQTITANSVSVSLNTYYPKLSEEPFILLKKADLKKKLELYKEDIQNYDSINKNTNSIMRRALFEHLINTQTEYEEIMIEIKKIESAGEKDTWKKLKENLPLFFLFQSDRTNSDSDGEVQNPLKIATKKALANLQNQLDEIKDAVEGIVSKVGEETIEKLKEFDDGIASSLKTNLNLKAWDSIFSFDLISDDDIPLNKRGSGVRRLILLSYFRAEAERISNDNNEKEIIYAIEEPETAQHPDYQKMILESLNAISESAQHQVIITTHTPEIAKMVELDDIIFIKKYEGHPTIEEDHNKKILNISNSLGILPNIQSKIVICVEGENDVNFLMNLNQSIEEFKNIIDLKEKKIPIIPLSGSKLINWINKDYLKDSNVIEYHVYDSDVNDYIEKIKEINRENDGRRYGINTSRSEMENYIPPILIEEYFGICMSDFYKEWEKTDIPKHLINTCMKNIQDSKKREQAIKGILNNTLTKKITATQLEENAAYTEIESWFKTIEQLYYKNSLKLEDLPI